MTWVKLLLLVLNIVKRIATTVQESKLLEAGEAKEVARSLAEISRQLGISQAVREEVSKMSDEDLDKDLRDD